MYTHNPKLKGSLIVSCVPQKGRCPVNCLDCFFQPSKETNKSRAYLGETYENTPNIPTEDIYKDKIVRLNDVNDSNNQRDLVMETAKPFSDKFFNTSMPKDLEGFEYPVVLTVNPAKMTDHSFHKLDPIPKNLMFVRARVNTWNLELIDQIVEYYTSREVFVTLTFMAYYETPIPDTHQQFYSYRQRVTNTYWVIRPEVWDMVVSRYKGNSYVTTCGKDANSASCASCGNCETGYFRSLRKLGIRSRLENFRKLVPWFVDLRGELVVQCPCCGGSIHVNSETSPEYVFDETTGNIKNIKCSNTTCGFSGDVLLENYQIRKFSEFHPDLL